MFTGVCLLKNEKPKKFSFPCLFIDYGSSIPRVKSSPILTRTHSLNLAVESVKTPWILFFKAGVEFLVKEFPVLEEKFDLIFSKGYYKNKKVDFNTLNYAFFIKTKKFPVLDNELSESEAFVKLFRQVKDLKSKEVKVPFWSISKL